jgi:hypothetical protein
MDRIHRSKAYVILLNITKQSKILQKTAKDNDILSDAKM